MENGGRSPQGGGFIGARRVFMHGQDTPASGDAPVLTELKKVRKCLTKNRAGHNLHMVSRIRNSNSDFSSEAYDPPPPGNTPAFGVLGVYL